VEDVAATVGVVLVVKVEVKSVVLVAKIEDDDEVMADEEEEEEEEEEVVDVEDVLEGKEDVLEDDEVKTELVVVAEEFVALSL